MRCPLVEAGWQILRTQSPETAALRAGTRIIAPRRGKRIAVVALARRLAGILYAMWRDGRTDDESSRGTINAPPGVNRVD